VERAGLDTRDRSGVFSPSMGLTRHILVMTALVTGSTASAAGGGTTTSSQSSASSSSGAGMGGARIDGLGAREPW
jgi:hypothetical protein